MAPVSQYHITIIIIIIIVISVCLVISACLVIILANQTQWPNR